VGEPVEAGRAAAVSLNLACPDWVERLKSGRSLIPDLPLPNVSEGERAVGIFNKLRLFDVPGTPSMAEAGGDWFRQIVRVLFASLDPVTKERLIREIFLLVAKKNNKTTGGALLMLTALLMNERPRAPFLLTGPVNKTADDAFAAAEGAIALDNVLNKKLHVRDHLKTIVHRETGAKLEIMTFDPDIVTGKKVVGALIDEEHILGKMTKAKKAMVQLRGGMMPFPEAFLAIITTQSDEAPSGVFAEDLTKAREIRDGKRQGKMLPVLYEFPEDMQRDPSKPWRNPQNWAMVTPNLGRSIALDTLVQACTDEEANGEAALQTWASQHLNIQIGVALQTMRWTGADFWERQGTTGLSLKEVLRRSEVVTMGIDGGGLDDLLACAVLGREVETGNWLHWGRAWADPTALQRRKDQAPMLLQFQADGDLGIAEIGQDIVELGDVVEEVEESGLLDNIGLDQAGIGTVVDEITGRGIAHERLIGIPQGWKLMSAIKATERKLAADQLHHGATRLMAYAVGNAKAEPRGNAVMITKQVSGTAKIDPLLALFDAAALMATNPKPRKKKFQLFFA
jgi:phage terminase large subunit-like protein